MMRHPDLRDAPLRDIRYESLPVQRAGVLTNYTVNLLLLLN